jgi:DNA recombination protein RmuC
VPFNSLIIILIAAVAAIVTGLLTYIYMQRRQQSLQSDNTRLSTELALERERAQERSAAFEQARAQLSETFSSLSSQALKHNTEEFLKLAQENLKQVQLQAQHELAQKEKTIEGLVKPIKETLERTEQQIRNMENERREAHGALSKHLETMAQTQQLLQGETRNLVQALSRPEVRGQWGELTLKRLTELAGMVEHCDFFEQEHHASEQGGLRPDMIVRMPGGREVVVDVKTPLDAYLQAVAASDDAARALAMEKHAGNLRKRVKELATKAYWDQFSKTPDFAVLFIPGDQFLSAALEIDHTLLEFALQQKIILATPTSLVALLRAVAYGWRQESLAQNAEEIRRVGEELYGRLGAFAEHLQKLGKSLNASVEHFNKAVGSYDSRILPSARKFNELGIAANKTVDSIDQVERTSRTVEYLSSFKE